MINLTEDFYLDADDNQFTLIQWAGKYDKKNNKTGMKYRYYSTLDSLLKGLATVLMRRDVQNSETLTELAEAIEISLAVVNCMAERIETICCATPEAT